MLEYVILERPVNWPQMCAFCTGTRGPVVSPHRELPGFGHLYVCEPCSKKLASSWGFFDGKRLDELSDAAATVEGLEREIDSLKEQLAGTQHVRDDLGVRLDATEENLSTARGRIAQLEARLREDANLALSLVGGGDDAAA